MSALLAVVLAISRIPWKAVARPATAIYSKFFSELVCHAVYDVDLELDSADTVIANGDTTAIDTEGGSLMWASLITGAMSGGGTTCDIYVQVSVNGGSNYYLASGGKFQQLGPTNDNVILRIPVYIPRPTISATVTTTKVRAHYVVAGGAPSYVITKLFLEPMLDPTVHATDESLSEGACARIAAT